MTPVSWREPDDLPDFRRFLAWPPLPRGLGIIRAGVLTLGLCSILFVLASQPVIDTYVSAAQFPSATGGLGSYFVTIGVVVVGLSVGSRRSVQVWGWSTRRSVLWRSSAAMAIFALPVALGYDASSWSGSVVTTIVAGVLVTCTLVSVTVAIALTVHSIRPSGPTRMLLRKGLGVQVGGYLLYYSVAAVIGPWFDGDWAKGAGSLPGIVAGLQAIPLTGWLMWVVDPVSPLSEAFRLALLAGLTVITASGALVAARWPGRTTPMSERKDQWT